MFDAPLRQRLDQPLETAAQPLASIGVGANALTGIGFLVGLGAAAAVVAGSWWLALILWLANRTLDGLDGSVARQVGPTRLGGFLDMIADFAIYGALVVALGWSVPDARLACLFVFFTYYLNGAAFLAWSSLVAQRAVSDVGTAHADDERGLNFPAGIAEGAETIAAMSIILLLPSFTAELMWGWAVIVGISVLQRVTLIVTRL